MHLQTLGARGLRGSLGLFPLFLPNTPHIVRLCVLFPVPQHFQLCCPGSLRRSLAKQTGAMGWKNSLGCLGLLLLRRRESSRDRPFHCLPPAASWTCWDPHPGPRVLLCPCLGPTLTRTSPGSLPRSLLSAPGPPAHIRCHFKSSKWSLSPPQCHSQRAGPECRPLR